MFHQPSRTKPVQEKPFSEELKKELDHILEVIRKQLGTPEDMLQFERMKDLMDRINQRKQQTEEILSPKEKLALRFIKRELKKGRQPSVREVAKAIGAKSSRTGARMVQKLALKKVI